MSKVAIPDFAEPQSSSDVSSVRSRAVSPDLAGDIVAISGERRDMMRAMRDAFRRGDEAEAMRLARQLVGL